MYCVSRPHPFKPTPKATCLSEKSKLLILRMGGRREGGEEGHCISFVGREAVF